MLIDRCVCFDVTFAELKAHVDARPNDRSLDALQRRFQCGRSCGLCIPYIREMLRTGRTRFDRIIT